jgi:EAL domain-containing protein (putative c-di-GMP-specific phosphodiesterase class I)
MASSTIDWFNERIQGYTTQRQYMRHRFLRTVQKQSPWLALASVLTILLGLSLIPLQVAFETNVLQTLGSFIFAVVSLRVVFEYWRWSPMTRLLIGVVLFWFLVQAYWLLSSPDSYATLSSHLILFQDSHGKIVTDVVMSLLVLLGYLLCHFRFNRISQTILCVPILMPVTGILAQAYQIPDAYGQLSLLFAIAGVLCAMSLIAKQVLHTPFSYLLLLDDTGQHVRWLIALMCLCAITLGSIVLFFGNDTRVTPLIITLALNCIVVIITFNYYRKGVLHEQVLPPEGLLFASELEAAIANEEFYLDYQPQIDFASGELVGVEALVRWQRPALGVVPPAKFISVAELTGLIVPMGAWVLRKACAEVATWKMGPLSNAKVSVNVSPLQLKSPGFNDYVLKVLQETGLSPERLVIELTESTFVHTDKKSIENLESLKLLGVKLAIDDFGTGYSCLAYLQDIPCDFLKVDRSFVHDVPGKARSEAVTSAIVVLGKNLQYQILAEGVETEAQAEYLKSLGCDLVQGYLYAYPMSESALHDWVGKRPPPATGFDAEPLSYAA